MTGKRGRYTTKQQEAVQTFIQAVPGQSYTIDEVFDELQDSDTPVGKSTVYRALERLLEDGILISILDRASGCMRYCYLEDVQGATCLVCNRCHRVFSLHCSSVTGFINHIEESHHFKVESQQTLLFGVCKECSSHV